MTQRRYTAGQYRDMASPAAQIKMGKKNPMWRGKQVGYYALHDWIKRRLPKPALCEHCKKCPPLDLSNASGKYRRDLSDWEWICRRCHMIKDGRIKKLSAHSPVARAAKGKTSPEERRKKVLEAGRARTVKLNAIVRNAQED